MRSMVNLKLVPGHVVGPVLVGGHAEGDQVQQGGYPAVQGRLLVAGMEVGLPLLGAPVSTELEIQHQNSF